MYSLGCGLGGLGFFANCWVLHRCLFPTRTLVLVLRHFNRLSLAPTLIVLHQRVTWRLRGAIAKYLKLQLGHTQVDAEAKVGLAAHLDGSSGIDK